ncbi:MULTISPECIES: hypothetical protein [unclassified Mesotoga]|uniref:hypothetical protein n=1 Tax=unclassified Mesotoga TaxID=1184398 RepID=UPI000D50F289|nr:MULTISPECIES: hypothetical protein [unclassified Mesotoga]PVD17570.1 hypothetical protein V512_011750 [Mesotoga sp. Brook.08.105.5.1]RAO95862.1 hypothetical protein M388_05035 [Mesotoga sp. Brook.08.YT.4.2.5.4.]
MEYEEIANLVSDSSKIPAMRRVTLSRSKVMEGFEKHLELLQEVFLSLVQKSISTMKLE